ncbi:Crp/Fnr family transcriptional regulator [Bacteroidales bacterium OttesenSCG-928-J19]|nr:Crp/Fnr family transcriptional regulator [Bacteroidales bacterium OttesenSCG-928-J19]
MNDPVLSSLSSLPDDSLSKLLALASMEEQAKGLLLIKAKVLNRNLYILKKGIARVFYPQGEAETNIAFCIEGDVVLSLKSYVEGQPGYENIELLEDCAFYKWQYDDLQRLYSEDIHIANWGRKMAEKEIIKTEERLISRQLRSASQRYQELVDSQPHLLQRVSLGHIASYLGVSPVTLSRIRAGIK